MKKIIYRALTPLIGLPLRNINRSGSLLCLHFGDARTDSGHQGSSGVAYDWTVQVQCPWRISQNSRIVIAYRDFYYSDVPLSNLAVMNKSRFNSLLDTLCSEFGTMPPEVEKIETDDTGNFSVHLSFGYQFEVFSTESTESGKHWRIFKPDVQGVSFVFPSNDS